MNLTKMYSYKHFRTLSISHLRILFYNIWIFAIKHRKFRSLVTDIGTLYKLYSQVKWLCKWFRINYFWEIIGNKASWMPHEIYCINCRLIIIFSQICVFFNFKGIFSLIRLLKKIRDHWNEICVFIALINIFI